MFQCHPVFHMLSNGQNHLAITPDNSSKLNQKETSRIQQIIGSLLYYARATNHTILAALKTIAQTQSKYTKTIITLCNHLLNNCTTYPTCYHKSDIEIRILMQHTLLSQDIFSSSLIQQQDNTVMLQSLLNAEHYVML